MKKEYQKPFTLLVKMETEGDFLMDSAHGTQHEGFTNSNTSTPVVEEGTDDDSPF
ncbi:single-stranded DNA-binding protein [Prevotella sp.]|uniref:single-stranded DNA-binding protein n=1 Tax=Prevotella sp. TaxID=59823 RepID=UPI001CABCCEE|nr:single-stranded DNA-binding protein [Prevotella sp.]MBF1639059.1 single-stranded DNA-binding protein [Prevotella sp.]